MTPYFHPFLTGLDGGDIACNTATNNQQIFLFYAVSVIAIRFCVSMGAFHQLL